MPMNTNNPKPPPLPPDVLTAIGNGPIARAWPSDPEMGLQSKIKARAEIDAGMWKTPEDIDRRTATYARWFSSMDGILTDETIERWMRYELMFAASALKYMRELQEAKDCVK